MERPFIRHLIDRGCWHSWTGCAAVGTWLVMLCMVWWRWQPDSCGHHSLWGVWLCLVDWGVV
jgi:hypothetical protein